MPSKQGRREEPAPATAPPAPSVRQSKENKGEPVAVEGCELDDNVGPQSNIIMRYECHKTLLARRSNQRLHLLMAWSICLAPC